MRAFHITLAATVFVGVLGIASTFAAETVPPCVTAAAVQAQLKADSLKVFTDAPTVDKLVAYVNSAPPASTFTADGAAVYGREGSRVVIVVLFRNGCAIERSGAQGDLIEIAHLIGPDV